MLIYNSAKNFIGIDEYDLKALGFSNLFELQSEAADFADLFVHTPGYVHNFKHVHWIDFVAYAESAEESKVIISVKSKSYTASLGISKAYLTENPTEEAYFVALNGLRPLSNSEHESVSSEARSKPAPVTLIDEKPYEEMIPDEPVVEDTFEIEDEVIKEIEDAPLDINFEEEEPEPIAQTYIAPVATPKDTAIDDNEGYVFDPKVASEELGLPVDLIEEFIQDFIGQSKEFKAEMYSSLEENELDNVAILSHKLKGVAANLRIEDALSAITTVNISKDPTIIKENLDLFYKIMGKLAGEDTVTKEDDFVIDFKEETPTEETPIEDTDVSEKIDLPGLAEDDLFVSKPDVEIEEKPITVTNTTPVIYSKELSANAIGLDMETFEELFGDYITDSRNVSSHIHQALSQGDFEKCAKEARILKGMSNSMQVKGFTEELESLISATDKNAMTSAIKRIDDVIEQISK